jgi:hypothetical protein
LNKKSIYLKVSKDFKVIDLFIVFKCDDARQTRKHINDEEAGYVSSGNGPRLIVYQDIIDSGCEEYDYHV